MKSTADIHMISFGLTEDLDKVFLFELTKNIETSQWGNNVITARDVFSFQGIISKNQNVLLVINANCDARVPTDMDCGCLYTSNLSSYPISAFINATKPKRVVFNLKGATPTDVENVISYIKSTNPGITECYLNGQGNLIDNNDVTALMQLQKEHQATLADAKNYTPLHQQSFTTMHPDTSNTTPLQPRHGSSNLKQPPRWITVFRASMFLVAGVSGILIPIVENTTEYHNPFDNIPFILFAMGGGMVGAVVLIDCLAKYRSPKRVSPQDINVGERISGTVFVIGCAALFASTVWALTVGEAVSLEGFQMENRTDRLFASLYGMLGVSSLLLGASEAVAMYARKDGVRNSFVDRVWPLVCNAHQS
jgi:hypothetical protein